MPSVGIFLKLIQPFNLNFLKNNISSLKMNYFYLPAQYFEFRNLLRKKI